MASLRMDRAKRPMYLVLTILSVYFIIQFSGYFSKSENIPTRKESILEPTSTLTSGNFRKSENVPTSKEYLLKRSSARTSGYINESENVPTNKQSLLKPSSALTSKVLTRNSTSWRDENGVCDSDSSDFVNATLKSPAGNTPIFIYNSHVDIWVSANILNNGIWEKDLVNRVYLSMMAHKDADFIDLGANVGVFGLSMAKMGRRVVLIDPLLSNVKRLCKSVRMGQFHNEVYIVHNAISNKRFKVSFGKLKGNVGGTYIREVTSEDTEVAQAIPLDDLLSIFNFKKVIMKMDIEGHETRALLGAKRFFKTVDVIVVQLEWAKHRKDGREIIEFLTRHNMKPFSPTEHVVPLDVNAFDKWPGDVVWEKV